MAVFFVYDRLRPKRFDHTYPISFAMVGQTRFRIINKKVPFIVKH
jgi:hypothetical protein